ncbi:gamma-tubulin complex component 2-like isoform X2 [Haemaphysalis longicornis]
MHRAAEAVTRNGTSHRKIVPADSSRTNKVISASGADMAAQRARRRKELDLKGNAETFAVPKVNLTGVTTRTKREAREEKHVQDVACERLPQKNDSLKGDVQKKVGTGVSNVTASSATSLTSFAAAVNSELRTKPDLMHLGSIQDDMKVSWDFAPESHMLADPRAEPIGALPVATQEYKLLEDLLFVMTGVDGTYIRSQPLLSLQSERTFTVDESAEPSLRDMVKKIFPLCSHHSLVVQFVEEKEERGQGLVNQALAAAMRSLLEDYLTLIAQLEHKLLNQGSLSLPKAWFYVQPALAYMGVLAGCAQAVWAGNSHGGRTLSVLHERATSLTGDTKAKEICLYLAKAASVPYFTMLENWVFRGRINDPFKEFLVGDKSNVKKEDMSIDTSDNYWNSRYALRKEMVPAFLKPIQDRILVAGKYQNVILQCGEKPKASSTGDERLVYSTDERAYAEKIDGAYRKASRTLLSLLMDKLDLMGRLRSVKHFFLMDQGDFVVQFMDMAEEELSQNIDDIAPTRLEVLLQLALSTSSVGHDRYKDCVKHQILECRLVSQAKHIMTSDSPGKKRKVGHQNAAPENITGHEAFTLNYDVDWPLNLVLSTASLGCYQMVFRFLFYCTHVERMLSKVWLRDKGAKLKTAAYPTAAFGLRQGMMHFVKNLQYYITVEVVDPSWHIFQDRLQKVQTVDEVLALHTELTDSFVNLCMLTNFPVFQLIHEILQQCLEFATFVMSDAEDAKFDERVQQYQRTFHVLVSSLRKKLLERGEGPPQGQESSLTEMLNRIDFNRFYSNLLAEKASKRPASKPTS